MHYLSLYNYTLALKTDTLKANRKEAANLTLAGKRRRHADNYFHLLALSGGSIHIHTAEVLFPLVLSTFIRQKYFFCWFYPHVYDRSTFSAGSIHIHTAEVLFPLVLSTFIRQKYFFCWFYPHSFGRSTFSAGSLSSSGRSS